MKTTNMECSFCRGKLRSKEGNSQILICEYCGSQFIMEGGRMISYDPHRDQYPFIQEVDKKRSAFSGLPGAVAILSVAAVICLLIMRYTLGGDYFEDRRTGLTDPDEDFFMDSADDREDWVKETDWQETQKEHSLLYESFIESVFDKSADAVTEEELYEIKYIRIDRDFEPAVIEYSFQSPYEEEGFEAEILELEPLSWDNSDLSSFTGLEKLDIGDDNAENIRLENMEHLKGLVCRGMTLSELATRIQMPEQMLELSLDKPESLDGIAVFVNLETLSLEDICTPDLRQLVPLKKLHSLYITETAPDSMFDSGEEQIILTDYTALSVLTELKTLHIESSSLRDLSFLSSLVNLESLSLSKTEAISLEPLGTLTQLVSLSLEDNYEIKDYAPVCNLSGLTSLILDKDTSQPDPDLSLLTQLQELEVSGLMSLSFFQKMDHLRHLSVHGCNIDEAQALAGLTGLESLIFYGNWTYAVPLRNVSFTDTMENLRSVDFSGGSEDDGWGIYRFNTDILGDISNVFNHQGLEELILNNCMFELDFGRLVENPSLKRLEMNEVSLKENFYVESYNGMTDIWYDDVSLDAHKDFLNAYPGLQELYLSGNELTDVQFTASLPELTRLDISNNYVTELSPLNQVRDLEYLDIRVNPITDTMEADDQITVLK